MKNCGSAFLLFAAFVLAAFLQTANALDQKSADVVINKYLAKQKTADGEGQSSGSVIADLNSDGKPEIVLLWAFMGPTYATNQLTVFTDAGKGYVPAASFDVTGQADAVSVKDGVILVDQMVAAKNDPLCCPSIKKKGKYRWSGSKILEVKTAR